MTGFPLPPPSTTDNLTEQGMPRLVLSTVMYHATDLIGSDALYYSTWYSQRRRSSVLRQPPNEHGTASNKGEARQHEVR